MLENPTANLSVLCNSSVKIRFKQLYLSNHSELVTCIQVYELSFPTMTNTIIYYSNELPPESPYIYVHWSEKI